MNEHQKEIIYGLIIAASITGSTYGGFLLGSKIEFEFYKSLYYPSPRHLIYELQNPIDNSLIICKSIQMTAEDINYGVELQKKVIKNNSLYGTKFKIDLAQVFRYAPNTLNAIKTKGIDATLNEAPIIEKIECKPKGEFK